MSNRRSGKEDSSKAVRGATLYSDKKKKRKKKKRTWKDKGENLRNTIYNRASDPQQEKQLINYLDKNGIEVNQYKDRYILRRLRVRMGRLKFNSYKDYLEYIRKHPTELGEIQESLSINVTRFFRNRDTYETVRDKVLPEMAKNKQSIKIWSAGCAVGAEPYSIAMIASDAVPKSTKVSIMATDVKEDLLRSARYGIYSKPYLAEMKKREITKYFSMTSDGDYKVKSNLKAMVRFKKQDLMKDDFPRNIDMIFCRNVLIYVDRSAQNIILNRFFEALKPGGILVLGRTETLFGDWRKSVNIISTKHRVYQKKTVGSFKKIKMTDPVSDLMGAKFSKRKSKNRGKTRDTLKHKKKEKDQPEKEEKLTTSERLKELRDFRKTFEERKKAWEERMERNRRERENRLRKLSDKRSTSRSKRRNISSQSRIQSSKEKTGKSSRSGSSLLDYRKNLKKAREPMRESKIRKDLDKDRNK